MDQLLLQLKAAKEHYYAKRVELEHARMKCPWWGSYLEILQQDHISPEAKQIVTRLTLIIASETQSEIRAEELALKQVNTILQQIDTYTILHKIESS